MPVEQKADVNQGASTALVSGWAVLVGQRTHATDVATVFQMVQLEICCPKVAVVARTVGDLR